MTVLAGLHATKLDARGVLKVEGNDARTFLQGIITNDIDKVSAERAIWAALLTPQGKYLHDFFICQAGDTLLLDCELSRRDDLAKRLKRFKLRLNVSVDTMDDFVVAALFPGASMPDSDGRNAGDAKEFEGGSLFIDPRLKDAGARAIVPTAAVDLLSANFDAAAATPEDYDSFRIGLGLPDGSRDMAVEKTVLLEAGFDELNGVDWQKGCYMGQEVTARTYHRGLVKRRLIPMDLHGAAPAPGQLIFDGDKQVGELTSVTATAALAMLRLDALAAGTTYSAGDAQAVPRPPAWVKF